MTSWTTRMHHRGATAPALLRAQLSPKGRSGAAPGFFTECSCGCFFLRAFLFLSATSIWLVILILPKEFRPMPFQELSGSALCESTTCHFLSASAGNLQHTRLLKASEEELLRRCTPCSASRRPAATKISSSFAAYLRGHWELHWQPHASHSSPGKR